MSSINDLPHDGQTSAASKDVEAQLAQLREDIAGLARSVAALGNEKASEVRGKARRAATDTVDASLQMVEDAKQQALSWERDVEEQIRTKPLQSVAIAAGVGFLFALITRR
ncbi:DUF883 domain-containing protein [Neorhizobium lilium]|uniref:DUF883 domain-containing protein n=1 Tax=Neorhizobium lilium TaxID=2503024 RepID=A0A444LJP3_9HYPH|nr:DUF883 family protein [Neorhizobium lilium]RWX79221.1 DUF883 domain-containing protein [Neorhizobium lilium]